MIPVAIASSVVCAVGVFGNLSKAENTEKKINDTVKLKLLNEYTVPYDKLSMYPDDQLAIVQIIPRECGFIKLFKKYTVTQIKSIGPFTNPAAQQQYMTSTATSTSSIPLIDGNTQVVQNVKHDVVPIVRHIVPQVRQIYETKEGNVISALNIKKVAVGGEYVYITEDVQKIETVFQLHIDQSFGFDNVLPKMVFNGNVEQFTLCNRNEADGKTIREELKNKYGLNNSYLCLINDKETYIYNYYNMKNIPLYIIGKKTNGVFYYDNLSLKLEDFENRIRDEIIKKYLLNDKKNADGYRTNSLLSGIGLFGSGIFLVSRL
ncbi:MAG: hypothetical protein Edafosvirus1_81 [Edafosvirus sp.]|uniref:Uncharacterized protein n=1 Tax=Edafosvirus sp. TaxID=2487765 RepID=A0A3G4ZS72_9VIRU|nr:MAG: hypothetical protein Edafosvirus1_81 [Edafosvirus sp.]